MSLNASRRGRTTWPALLADTGSNGRADSLRGWCRITYGKSGRPPDAAECSVFQLRFQDIGRRRVESDFVAGLVTSDADEPLLCEAASASGLGASTAVTKPLPVEQLVLIVAELLLGIGTMPEDPGTVRRSGCSRIRRVSSVSMPPKGPACEFCQFSPVR
jgi:hypothetical protein